MHLHFDGYSQRQIKQVAAGKCISEPGYMIEVQSVQLWKFYTEWEYELVECTCSGVLSDESDVFMFIVSEGT